MYVHIFHQATITVHALRYIVPCIYHPHFGYDWLSYERIFQYTELYKAA
jgi:hypothetical protein